MNEASTESSASEIQQLLIGLHPRKPADVMGEAATSSLIGSTIVAAIGWAGVLIVGTIVVFAVGGGPIQKQAPSTAEVQTAPNASPDLKTPTAEPVAPTPLVEQTQPLDSAVEAMGIGETKEADASANPLENRLDQLLDGLE